MADEKSLQECLAYFQKRPVFARLFEGFREKYRSYGCCAGNVQVSGLDEKMLGDLEGFMQKNYHGKKCVKITVRQFAQALQESRFSDVGLEELIEAYFDEPLLSKKEQRDAVEKSWEKLIRERLEKAKIPLSQRWLNELLTAARERETFNKSLAFIKKQAGAENPDFATARALIDLGVRILELLPAQPQRSLAVFAAGLTGDPHAFDRGRMERAFLRLLVNWMQPESSDGQVRSVLAEQKLFLSVGLLNNDVSNYVMTLGLRAWKENGEEHLGMAGYFEEKEPVQISLSVLAKWKEVRCPNDRLYMVENPSVYAVLCERWNEEQALVCVGGEPHLSHYVLLDLLAPDTEIWYAGDFDPEGLLIADRLANYYRGKFHCWRMSAQDYQVSKPLKSIEERRLKKLESITIPALRETAAAIKITGLAGYQENLLQNYIDDLI